MKLHEITHAPNARHSEKRLGRGIGSGVGKTSGKGHKGQNARSGGGVRPGFEGGQMSLMRRIPKRGFDNRWKAEYTVVNVSDLEAFDNGATVDAVTLLDAGIIKKVCPYGLKVLGDGDLTKKLTVKAAKFSKSASEKIVKAGGSAEVTHS